MILNRRHFGVATAGALASAIGVPARAADKVTIYTAAPQDLIDQVVPAFETASKLKVELVKAGSGELINRLKAEKGRQGADVIWSVAGEVLEANAALFTKHAPDNARFIAEAFRIDDAWVPFTAVCSSFGVNTKLLTPAQYPKTWADLANPQLKGRISAARPDKSGSAFIQLATILQIYGEDKGWELYTRILDNLVLSNSSGAVPKFVNDGEAAVGLSNEDTVLKFKQGGGPVDIVYPGEGTSASADGMALLANPVNADGGKAFMNYMLSKPAQEIIDAAGRRSIRTDVVSRNSLTPMDRIKIIKFNTEWAGANRVRLLAKWNDLLLAKK